MNKTSKVTIAVSVGLTLAALLAGQETSTLAQSASGVHGGSKGHTTVYHLAGEYSHVGDCAWERYAIAESGAAGYCYIVPSDTVSIVTVDAEEIVIEASTPVVTVEAVVIVEDTKSADESAHGNPGNTRDVGNAGEDPNGRGTMDNDNAGGNGNGEHGNQGENNRP